MGASLSPSPSTAPFVTVARRLGDRVVGFFGSLRDERATVAVLDPELTAKAAVFAEPHPARAAARKHKKQKPPLGGLDPAAEANGGGEVNLGSGGHPCKC